MSLPQGSEPTAFRYRAFISYSHQDKAWADWLHKALETYVVPQRLVGQTTAAGVIPKRLAPIFRDRDELASAHDLGRKVNEALAQSANLIVICSPRAAGSRWVNEEVLAYKRLGRSERIFCLIVDGEPNGSDVPGHEAQECFVPSLRYQLDPNGEPSSEPAEPIAADARPGKDGKGNARLKLIAGLLEVGFDQLKQRELQRRTRRLTAIAALAVAVMAVTTTLAIFALVSRHTAVVASQSAERRQKQAEDLVSFMLGDLNDKLVQVSRLDIMQSVDDKAMAYFQSLPASDVTDEALAQRAKALEKIGSVRLDQGNLAGAMDSYQAALKLSGRLAEAAPADAARHISYARLWSFVGMTYWYQSDLDAALRNFEHARNILQRTQASASNNLSLKSELWSTENNIGHVLEARGQPQAAATTYRDALALARELVAANPRKTDWMANLGDSHNNLGKLALQRGDLAQAVAEYRADDVIETHLSARDPRNTEQRENVLRVRAILGRTLTLAGDFDSGIQNLQQAVDIARQLVRLDPEQTDFQSKLAVYLSQSSRLQRLNGDLPEAQALTAQSLSILATLTRHDPANAGWQQQYAEARIEQAAQSLVARQADTARVQAQAALSMIEPLFAKQPDNRSLLLDTVAANLLLADASKDASTAQRLRNEVWKITQVVKNRDDPRLLALQVETLLGLGKNADAQPLIKRLWNTGYRDPALLAVLRRAHISFPVNVPFAQRITQIMQADATPPASPSSSARHTSPGQ